VGVESPIWIRRQLVDLSGGNSTHAKVNRKSQPGLQHEGRRQNGQPTERQVVRPKVTLGGARFTRARHGWAGVPTEGLRRRCDSSAWMGSAAGAMHLGYLYTYTNMPTQGQAIPRHPLGAYRTRESTLLLSNFPCKERGLLR
jgi:hypothetical protein